MKIIVFLSFIFYLLSSCEPSKLKSSFDLYWQIDSLACNRTTEQEKSYGWKLLFDGKTLKGWHAFNLDSIPTSWNIEDSCITVTSTDGQEGIELLTDSSYENYAICIDFKLSKSSQSGIVFQTVEDKKYKHTYETGAKYAIIDQENWKGSLEKWETTGANYGMYPPRLQAIRPNGYWNRLLIVVQGKHVTQMLNGVITLQYEKNSSDWNTKRKTCKHAQFVDWGKFDKGHIALQNYGSKVWFRNIKINLLK